MKESSSGKFEPRGLLAEPASTGRVYWRSLDELANTPEFRAWAEREFPEGASEWSDPVSRRHFVKIMSASFLLAGLGFAGSGCRRPEERIMPFTRLPENYTHGVPQFYATAMPGRTSALPLIVKSHEGRPVKIEGNDLYAETNGGTDRWAQASILNLYDPDRASKCKEGGNTRSREAAFEMLAAISTEAQAAGGQGLAFLCEHSSSPSRQRLEKALAARFPSAKWYVHEPVDTDITRRAALAAFGKSLRPHYLLEKADVVVSLDCDFLGSEDNVAQNIRAFASRRRIETAQSESNRLYIVESLLTLTGSNADHRLRIPANLVQAVAASLASQLVPSPAGTSAEVPGVDPKWISECARDLAAHKGKSLVVAGHRQPLAVHVLAYALNAALGNIGKTVLFYDGPKGKEEGLPELAKALNAGQVDTLVILDGNPVYTAPGDLNWAATQRKAKRIVRLGYYEDETFAACDWHLPSAHYLESWGDGLTNEGVLVPVQPLIAPLMGGLTDLELLARMAGEKVTTPYDIVRETFAGFAGGGDIEAAWRKFLHDGFLAGSAAKPVDVQLNNDSVAKAIAGVKAGVPSRDNLELVFHRDYSVDDGRYGNNGWLQELPDPITKIVWDNAVLMSRQTAQELGVKNSDVVEVTAGGRSVRGPVWIQPGFADYSLGLALGYGRERAGRVGHKTGFNVYPLRPSGAESIVLGAKLSRAGQTYPISCTQAHWSLEGRPIIREANLEQYRKDPHFAKKMGVEDLPVTKSLYPNPLDQLKPSALHQWGMSIDLNMCVGCSACVVACQSENNVPIVGKEQVGKGREMHWLRIDRYYSADPHRDRLLTYRKEEDQQFEHWIDNPQVVTQPMLCQHCEAAPCENVCPVNATSHDLEGLNVMTYNRCVGTRYCSNNCPYKVRRFNFFDYNKRPIDKLYLGPLAKRNEDEWDLIRMIKNPDVTVRMRGVMEKCTFCLQRIEGAKIAQKTKAGASGDVIVPEGTFTTACAQACPAGAIVFGNLNDPDSHVSKRKESDRDYPVLEGLLTKPRTTYLARVRNPNPAMPDYYESPMSYQEYEARMTHGGAHPKESHEPADAAAEKGAR